MRRCSYLAQRLLGEGGSTTAEEKIPFAAQSNYIPDAGSIARTAPDKLASYESKPLGGLPSESSADLLSSGMDTGEGDLPKMGVARRLLFLLSFNGWVVYVATLLWFIPCRQPDCIPLQNWTRQWSGQMTTNLEMTKVLNSTSIMVCGFSDSFGEHLVSLATADGEMAWNKSTPAVLRNVFCNLRVDMVPGRNYSGIPDCIGTGYNFVGAYSLATGDSIWEQRLINTEEETIRRIALTSNLGYKFSLFGVGDEFLFVLDPINGSLSSSITLPCSWTIDVKLIGPWIVDNGTTWTVVCEFGDSLEVWTFDEGEALSPPPPGNGKYRRTDVRFGLLFSVSGSGGEGVESIDLAGDVTWKGNSMALSWADRVVMVTHQASQLQKTWERRFAGQIVTGVSFGHFTNPNKFQLAVAVQDYQNTTIHILETLNGKTLTTKFLGSVTVASLGIVEDETKADTIILETILQKENSSSVSQSVREFSVLRYMKNKEFEKTLIAETKPYASSVSRLCDGVANLVIANRVADGETTISRYVISSDLEKPTCHPKKKKVPTLHVVD